MSFVNNYIYVFSLEVSKKIVAKYVGKHYYDKATEEERFDLEYLGSGSCWRWLLKEYGYTRKHKWVKNPDVLGEYICRGDNDTLLRGRIIFDNICEQYLDEAETIAIESLVRSEGLNKTLIEKFRKTLSNAEGDNIIKSGHVKDFIEKHRGHSDGLLVNQVSDSSCFEVLLKKRKELVEQKPLRNLIEEDKKKFLDGTLKLYDFVSFNGKDVCQKKRVPFIAVMNGLNVYSKKSSIQEASEEYFEADKEYVDRLKDTFRNSYVRRIMYKIYKDIDYYGLCYPSEIVAPVAELVDRGTSDWEVEDFKNEDKYKILLAEAEQSYK